MLSIHVPHHSSEAKTSPKNTPDLSANIEEKIKMSTKANEVKNFAPTMPSKTPPRTANYPVGSATPRPARPKEPERSTTPRAR
jgi:hypothetical protein